MNDLWKPGDGIRSFLLRGAPTTNEGEYRFDHWAVRLGPEPHSSGARMATLHESYHATLNDSTAYGTLLHAAAALVRRHPEHAAYNDLLERLIEGAIDVHESYATYSSAFIVGHGWIDPHLLDPYPGYRALLARAQAISAAMPNEITGFQLVQAATRAAMQGHCQRVFADTPLAQWSAERLDLSQRPDARLEPLEDSSFLRSARAALDAMTHSDPEADEICGANLEVRAEYDALIREEMDSAIDRIGVLLYTCCRDELRRLGLGCLDFNGHQSMTAAVLTRLGSPSLRAAPEGTLSLDIVAGFSYETIVLSPDPLPSVWYALQDIPESRWSELVAGPTPHAQLVLRPADRLLKQYDFAPPPPFSDQLGAVAALRRRTSGPQGPLLEHIFIASPAQLTRFADRLGKPVLSSCAMSVLASPTWQAEWLPALKSLAHMHVLVDLDPFAQVRRWVRQAEFRTSFATLDLAGDDRRYVVFALYPQTGDDLVYLFPCTAVLAAAFTLELRSHPEHFVEDQSPFLNQLAAINLSLSHLLREEPWFDFGAHRGVRP